MLAKCNRLPSSEISRVMREGKKIYINGITLIYRFDSRNLGLHIADDSGNQRVSRFCFIVSTKVDKRATVRNRLRRLMSEAVRLIVVKTYNIDCVVIGSKQLIGKTQKEMQQILQEALHETIVS